MVGDKTEVTIHQVGVPEGFLGPESEAGFAATFDKLDPRILPDMGVKVTFLGEERTAPAAAATVLLGDFNAEPGSAEIGLVRGAGLTVSFPVWQSRRRRGRRRSC